jgi:hypothetical protein
VKRNLDKSKFDRPEVREVKLSDMNPAAYNPRAISDEAKEGLRGSLEAFGLLQDIVWNQRTGNIVGGHQRHSVLLETEGGDSYVPVKVVDLDLMEEKALNIALNNPHIAGQFTPDVVDIIRDLLNDDIGAELVPTVRLDQLMPVNDTSFLDNLGDGDSDGDDGSGGEGKKGRGKNESSSGYVDFVVSLSGEDNEFLFMQIRAAKNRAKQAGETLNTSQALIHIAREWADRKD